MKENASILRTLQLFLFPTFLLFISCEKDIDEKIDYAPSHIQAVDLGLSVKWANCNIGADSPENHGGYYAWGETTEKEEYTSQTYKHYLGDLNENGIYNESEEYKNIGDNISGTIYDAARTKWGGTWRMPTNEEFKELCKKCSWAATEINGIKGKLITGPNGNSIFLPCTGISSEKEPDTKEIGSYWSANLGFSRSFASCILFIYNDIVSGDREWNAYRQYGLPIRPVTE